MGVEPFGNLLFRTEEVVHSSTASQKDPGRGRRELLYTAVFKHQMDALPAVLRGIFDGDFSVAPFRVDQRDEVECSIRIERPQSRHVHAMVHEVNAPEPLPLDVAAAGHSISDSASVWIAPDDSQLLQHLQPGFHLW